jgi:hypothetical protein
MPKITENMRGVGTFLGNTANQAVNQTVTGLKGENQEWDIGDIKQPLKNIATLGFPLGLIKTLFGAHKAGGQPTSNVGQLAQYDFGGDQFGTSPISTNPFAPTEYDMSNMMPMMNTQISNMFQTQRQTPDFYRPPIQKTGETSVQDFTNTFSAPSGSGLQMPQEQQAQQQAQPQVMDTQTVTAPPQQRVTPQKMPMPSDLDYIFGADQSAYQSRSAPSYVNPMTANKGYFDMNKAGTVGGNYVQGAGWLTQADKAFGKKAEDLQFEAMMRQRMANMFS